MSDGGPARPAGNEAEREASGGVVLWHDLECGSYAADLALWEELAPGDGPVLELGCGTGRVSLHLARRGHEVWAVDSNGELVEELVARSAAEGLSVRATHADVRELALKATFASILAPMQVLQLVGGRAQRALALERTRAHLSPGGRLAAAIVEGTPHELAGPVAPLPDIRETDGWLHSSLPLGVFSRNGRIEIRRRRQVVTPKGELNESEHAETIESLGAAALEEEGRAVGFRPAGRREVAPGDGHIGSTVVILEAT
jgi:SAM-dependent methyltransferase